jgi:hypothetical protein
MPEYSSVRARLGASAAIAALAAVPGIAGAAQVPPPLSTRAAHFYATHPAAYAKFMAQLATGPSATPPAHEPRFATATGGTWQDVTKAPGSLVSPLLLTDGTVIAQSGDTPYWYKLTPDNTGSYAHGTWSSIANLPLVNGAQYAPLYHASAVLPDGRVIIEGGEYNNSNHGVWTNAGAIYDPVADSWTPVAPPFSSAWAQIGDAQSVVLPDGTFMLATCCAYNPTADAYLNPKSLAWTSVPGPNGAAPLRYQDEQGYELLPNGYVLTVDVWQDYPNGNATKAERYDPAMRKWRSAGNTPVSLIDPAQCGNYEVGPAVLRGDGTVVAFGGNTGCVTGATDDPTAIYKSGTNAWTAGPNVPAVCGSDGTTSCDLADAPAALLPDGNILFAASAGYGGMPTHFFEYGSSNTIAQVSDPLHNASTSGAYYYNFLVLPNGQVLMTDFSKTAEVYTPAGSTVANWAPRILSVPASVTTGKSYQIIGEQLNGRSQGAYYGDDAQMATNYPILRLTNTASGHVSYARSTGFSTMSVAAKTLGSAKFVLPAGIETGPSTMVAVANGIASAPVLVDVK